MSSINAAKVLDILLVLKFHHGALVTWKFCLKTSVVNETFSYKKKYIISMQVQLLRDCVFILVIACR